MLLHSRIEGEGTPMVIIHGFLGMSDNWKTLGSQFATEGFQVHALDLRNHGKSFHSEDFSYEVMVEDVKQYCEYHQLNNIIIIGHSMGGKVAMLLATTYPELVSKLIVADIGPKYYAPHHQTILAALKISFKTITPIIITYLIFFASLSVSLSIKISLILTEPLTFLVRILPLSLPVRTLTLT